MLVKLWTCPSHLKNFTTLPCENAELIRLMEGILFPFKCWWLWKGELCCVASWMSGKQRHSMDTHFPRYSSYSLQVRWANLWAVDVKFSPDFMYQKSLKSVNFILAELFRSKRWPFLRHSVRTSSLIILASVFFSKQKGAGTLYQPARSRKHWIYQFLPREAV